MAWEDKVYFYADCSMNIAPDAETLAEIGRASAQSARAFGHEPRVAFLSYSTSDSAKDASVDKVKEAVALVRKAEPNLLVDGELQFDAAVVPEVAKKKCPGSPLEGRANVFIFPDLNSGNIAYKLTERLAGARAIGPIFQGLNQPANDVSRGCSVQDFADVAVMTALSWLPSWRRASSRLSWLRASSRPSWLQASWLRPSWLQASSPTSSLPSVVSPLLKE